jgi:hypothetical protein
MVTTEDFKFYQGEDYLPYFAIKNEAGVAVNLTTSLCSEIVWVAMHPSTLEYLVTKHYTTPAEGITIRNDPVTAAVHSCIFVHILPADTQDLGDAGTYRHELRATIGSANTEVVLYPPVDDVATFRVVDSLTWSTSTHQPRLVRPTEKFKPEAEPTPVAMPKGTLKRVPKLAKRK